MKKILVLPTWILINILTPILPDYHPWYKKRFSLKEWSTNSRFLNYIFSILFWIHIIFIIYLFI